MFIIFNPSAFTQALILIPFVIVFYILTEVFGIGRGLNGNLALIYEFLGVALITGITDIYGIKGRLLFLPTWLLCTIATTFLLTLLSKEQSAFHSPIIYGLIALIYVGYYHFFKVFTGIKWAHLKIEMRKYVSTDFTVLTKKEYWESIGNLYVEPHVLFLYYPAIWNLLFPNTLSGNEFLNHYKQLFDNLKSNKFLKVN